MVYFKWYSTLAFTIGSFRGGAPIGAGGVMTPTLFEAKGDGGIIWE